MRNAHAVRPVGDGGGARLGPLPTRAALSCRRKFLRYFPAGFYDAKYIAWERGYKWDAHERWERELGKKELATLLSQEAHLEVAARAIRIESRTNLLFSFEKMALRDAVRDPTGARPFAESLYALLHGSGSLDRRFAAYCDTIAALPRKGTRVLTWPVATVFPFLARPDLHLFVKPNVIRRAARAYGVELPYASRPSPATYTAMLGFTDRLQQELADLRPRDLIDIQSFLWVQGSEEYPE